MSRSTYIYVLKHDDRIMGVWTVKKEMVHYIETNWAHDVVGVCERWRDGVGITKDNSRGFFGYVDLTPELAK